jgi:hypothetical protein
MKPIDKAKQSGGLLKKYIKENSTVHVDACFA